MWNVLEYHHSTGECLSMSTNHHLYTLMDRIELQIELNKLPITGKHYHLHRNIGKKIPNQAFLLHLGVVVAIGNLSISNAS